MLHYACSKTHCSLLDPLFLDVYAMFHACISHIQNIFQCCHLSHWKAAFWINNSHSICMHLMLSSVVRRAISLAASVPQHHGQLLLFSIQRDSGWFQHHGQLPTLYYSGSWSELILAWSLECLFSLTSALFTAPVLFWAVSSSVPHIQKAKNAVAPVIRNQAIILCQKEFLNILN